MQWATLFLCLFLDSSFAKKLEKATRKCCPGGSISSNNNYQCEEGGEDRGLNNVELPVCEEKDSVIFTNKTSSIDLKNAEKHATDHCVDRTSDDQPLIVACGPLSNVQNISKNIFIRKCCGIFEIMLSDPAGQCNYTDLRIKPTFFDKNNFSLEVKDFVNYVNFVTPGCGEKELLSSDDYGDFKILTDGMLYIPGINGTELPVPNFKEPENFCVDMVDGFDDVQIFLCNEKRKNYGIIEILQVTGLIISIVFLILTFLIYACEITMRNLYGKLLMCHIGSIAVGYTLLATLQLEPDLSEEANYGCAYLMLLSFLAAFFWLNVMSFDIWRTFRSIRSRDLTRGRKMLRFFCYSAYGWGMPALLTLIAILITNYEILPPELNIMKLRVKDGWFDRGEWSYYIFFITPISLIITTNVVLYVITAWQCYQVKKDINNRKNNDSTKKNNFFKRREQLVLNIKLFLVMGVSWSLEVVSYLLKKESQLFFLWYIPDAVNSLHGLLIFIIFALKKKNFRNISRRMSTWTGKRSVGSETLLDGRKTSTTLNPSTTVTS